MNGLLVGHMAGPARAAEPIGLGSMESLLRCIFSNPEATFNFIKKRMKSNLAAGQLVVCVSSFCVLSFLLGLVPCLSSSSALGLGEVLLTRSQPQASGRSGLSLLQRPQRGVEESRPGIHVQQGGHRLPFPPPRVANRHMWAKTWGQWYFTILGVSVSSLLN